MFFDPLYFIFLLPAITLAGWAQWHVHSTYRRYSQVPNLHGASGARAARALLDTAGLANVQVEATPGELTDHYDPRDKTVRLSEGVYGHTSVAAIGIVAHEVGHAIQDAHGYAPMQLRASLVPVANLGSQLGPWLVIIGLFLGLLEMAWLGILFFTAAVAFSLVTLPVEWDASNRAKAMLTNAGLVVGDDYQGVSRVLNAAALTYVASLLVAVMQLAYFLARVSMLRRDE